MKKIFLLLIQIFVFAPSFSDETEKNFVNSSDLSQITVTQENVISESKKVDLINIQVTNYLDKEIRIANSELYLTILSEQTKSFKIPRENLQNLGLEFLDYLTPTSAKAFSCRFNECSILFADRLVGYLCQSDDKIYFIIRPIGLEIGGVKIFWEKKSLEVIEL